MLPLNSFFEELRKSIEPGDKYKKAAQEAHEPVREHLASHESFKDYHETTFLYGSYARQTANGNIKDVDIVVVTNFTTDDNPLDVLDTLKISLSEIYNEPELGDQRRSIRVDRPLPDDPNSELTLDVIPAIYKDGPGGPLWVPDREKQIWVLTHPSAHLEYTSELNKNSHDGKMFVPLAKMLKWWWQHQYNLRFPNAEGHTRKPKGFWIEVMAGTYADLSKTTYPELIQSVFENAYADFLSFRDSGFMPELSDPGLSTVPGYEAAVIKTSMTEEEFALFLTVLEQSLLWVRVAANAANESQAIKYWQAIFGQNNFPSIDEMKRRALLLTPVAPVLSTLRFPNKPILPKRPGGFA